MENCGTDQAADANQETTRRELMSTKPLHRFVQMEPRSLGIVILILGCTELLMGFQQADEYKRTSRLIYVPFWQGTLFLVCGSLSIYTGIHPSKKMVTVCLSIYVVSLLGIIVSAGYRIRCLSYSRFLTYRPSYLYEPWAQKTVNLLYGVEGLLFLSSLCVSVLLIFLCVVARLALKSTHTQIVLHQIPPPVTETPSE